jgi:hypothetical protein
MNKMLPTCLHGILLLIGVFAAAMFVSSAARAQGDGIIVDGGDYVSTMISEHSAQLANVTSEVTSRVAVEYVDFSSKLELNESSGLYLQASNVTSRVSVEYADFVSGYELRSSDALLQAASNVTSRMIVEYADFVFGTISGPNPVEAIPEFPSFLILPLFFIATLLAVIVYRRKRFYSTGK